MLLLVLGAFLAGSLTVLAPCVLPLLPIIIGGSMTGETKSLKRPLYITASLAVSLFVFTLLLKVTTVLINIPPDSINYISGGIIITLGIVTLFPSLYARALASLGIETKAMKLLGKGTSRKDSMLGAIITGAALGPVFSSCSPVYGYILATVLPVNFAVAMVYIIAYILGLSLVLLLIGYYGQQFIGKISWMSNPKGAFQRGIAILFIAVGLLLVTGNALKFQTWVSENTPFDIDGLSAMLIPADVRPLDEGELLNVEEPFEAPELVGLDNWINSEPFTLQDTRGKVVLIDFWTYSCINCIRNNPHIQEWHEKYADDGLVVLGVHAPEFAFERIPENVQNAVDDQGITYPVALDNGFMTWGAFKNRFWPAAYFIDSEGFVRRIHTGEGEYRESEEAIRLLLEEAGADLDSEMSAFGEESEVPVSARQTPETYLGTSRAENFASLEPLSSDPETGFNFPQSLANNQWALSGKWQVDGDKIIAETDARLRFNISSKEVYFVANSSTEKNVRVLLDGKPISETNSAGADVDNSDLSVGGAKLYRLVQHDSFVENFTVEIVVPRSVEINVFTFGS